MNKQQLKKGLEFVSAAPANEISLVMYFILKDLSIRKADIDDEAMASLRDQFVKNIAANLIGNDELHFTGITTADNRKNAAYFFDLDKLPEGLRVMGRLLRNQKAELFDFKKDHYEDTVGFVFLLGNVTSKIAIYKKQYPINLLGRDAFVRLVKSRQRLVRVKEDIININEKFDFMQIGDEVIVINMDTLEKYFGFEDVIRSSAENNLQTIEKANLLVDVEPLREMISDLRYARKLMRVKAAPAVLELPFDQVRSFIKQHPKLRRRMRFNQDETRISLDTKTSKELFLKLLDDDFLRSDLTNILYEAEIKDPLSNEEASD
jgi:hypothetical protein